MIIPISLFILGLIGLWFFSDFVVSRSIKVAIALNITPAFIGLTLLSIGTSMPELTTALVSSYHVLHGIDASSIAISTNIGSDLFQITFIMGLVALFTTVHANKKILQRDYPMMVFATLLVFIFSFGGYLSRIEGFIMLAIYGWYLLRLLDGEKIIRKKADKNNYFLDVIIICFGIAGLLFAGKLVVDNALFFSIKFGIDQTFFGALLIGLTSALPELSTVMQGIRRKSQGISLGVLIGSNVTNPLMMIGIGALISGYTVSKELMMVDMPFYIITTIIIYFFFNKNLKISKIQATALIGFYLIFALLKARLLF